MNKVAIIQPNEITNARYNFTALQKNIIYLIYEKLQGYITKEQGLNQDLFNNFVVSVPVAALAGEKNHSKVIDAAKGLMKNPFEYNYERDKKKYTVATVLVHTAKHEHGTDRVEITIPFEALSLLLYVGKGFTMYQLPIALTLKSKHAKRMYELCCRWKDRGGFGMELLELRQMLMVEKKYKDVNLFRQFVLDRAKNELKESADVWFDYELQKVKSRSFNFVYFTIFHNDLKEKNADKGVYPNIYNFLALTFSPIVNDKAMRIADQLADRLQLQAAWKKFKPLSEAHRKNGMDGKHLMNITRKILREDFQINVD